MSQAKKLVEKNALSFVSSTKQANKVCQKEGRHTKEEKKTIFFS
jgi:hypothetical protein